MPAGEPKKIWLPEPLGIIAIDPGAKCGFACLHWAEDAVIPYEANVVTTLDMVNRMLYSSRYTQWRVVSERFIPQGGVLTPQYDAIETNGALRWIASQYDATFQLQDRAAAKKAVSNSTLREIGWHIQTKDGHADDAQRHLGLALLTHHPVEWLALFS